MMRRKSWFKRNLMGIGFLWSYKGRSNLKKKRLVRIDPQWVAAWQVRLDML